LTCEKTGIVIVSNPVGEGSDRGPKGPIRIGPEYAEDMESKAINANRKKDVTKNASKAKGKNKEKEKKKDLLGF